MYLSKVSLMGGRSLASRLLELDRNDAYASHQLLWKEMFHQDEARHFIYRHDIDHRKMPVFYVLSQTEPSLSESLEIQTKVFAPTLHAGQRLSYQLRLNPTVSRKDANGRIRRHDVMMDTKHRFRGSDISRGERQQKMTEAVQQWLCEESRLKKWGIQMATVPDVHSYTQHRIFKKKRHESQGHDVRFSSVDAQGLLTVIDPDKFLEQYPKGFGRMKSMGCGLMLFRRA